MTFEGRSTNRTDGRDRRSFGNLSMRYDYVFKQNTGDGSYPSDAARPWLHYNMRVGNIRASGMISAPIFRGTLIGRATKNKSFDIPHPNKPGKRLRHTCLEGPENAVYIRGRLTNESTIELPDYWDGFVDPESITIQLTQIGSQQDLIVDKIEWGKNILIRSGSGCSIDCYYLIYGARIDGEPLIVEYDGETPADYPGNNSQYSVAGYNYDVRLEQKPKPIRKTSNNKS